MFFVETQTKKQMIQIEFLDILYKSKVEAEQELEKIEDKQNDPIPAEYADWAKNIRELELRNAKSLVNRYATLIKLYLSHHNHS